MKTAKPPLSHNSSPRRRRLGDSAGMPTALPAVLLVGAARAQFGVPSPPPPQFIPCEWSPPGHADIKYDLSGLQQAHNDLQLQKQGDVGSKFYVRVCAPPSHRCTAQSCPDCTVHTPAGTNVWSSGGGEDTCAAIGSLHDHTFSLQDPLRPAGGVKMQFSGGDGGRSATISFLCSGNGGIQAAGPVVEHPPTHYLINVSSAAACAITPQPLSWGWLTIILSGVTLVVYLGGGIAYNHKVRTAHPRPQRAQRRVPCARAGPRKPAQARVSPRRPA